MLLNKATTDLGRDAISEKELIMGLVKILERRDLLVKRIKKKQTITT